MTKVVSGIIMNTYRTIIVVVNEFLFLLIEGIINVFSENMQNGLYYSTMKPLEKLLLQNYPFCLCFLHAQVKKILLRGCPSMTQM